MRIRNSFLSLAGLCAMLGAASAFGQAPDRQSLRPSDRANIAKVGQPAPNFTLNDASGKAHTLADYQGKLVVLQWINPDCPICARVNRSGITTKMAKAIRAVEKDFVHLTIHSTHYMEPDKSVAYLKQHKVKAPVLDDRNAKVGHLYGAKTTPHMYVIDKKGILRYAGAIDDDPNGTNREGATNYVINAVRQIAAGETVAPDLTKAYGCSIKYDPNAPKRERPARGQRGNRQGRGIFGSGQMFGRADVNGDGKIDANELAELPEQARERMLEFDKNGDGTLDADELKAMRDAMQEARRQRMLERYDKDGDGELSDEEREAMRQDRRGGRGGDGGRRGGRGGDGGAY